MDDKGQIFLLLMWAITLCALIASLWLFRDLKTTSNAINAPTPYTIPREAARAKTKDGFEVPPPPW